jgi:predicted N-acetyltransferase YhbS
MSVSLRPVTSDDAADCGKICFDAFSAMAARHNFHLDDFPSAEVGSELIGHLVAHPRFYGVVVESDGRIVGSNFMGERGEVFGLGPITVEPEFQGRSVGRKLMQHMIDRTLRAACRTLPVFDPLLGLRRGHRPRETSTCQIVSSSSV